jgi:hypothetical protein
MPRKAIICMLSKAKIALEENLDDVKRLLEFHAHEGGDAAGRRIGLEVLNKSAIVLITSYWEAYCEDLAEEALEHIVGNAKTSDALPNEIKQLIAKELTDKTKEPHELAIWAIADDKWRSLLRKRFTQLTEDRNRKLNKPSFKNIDDLFNKSIGLSDVSSQWNWPKRRLTAQKAREKLDKYVNLRCEIAHRGKANTSVRKRQVEDYFEFIERTAKRTRSTVNKHVESITR